MRILTTGWVWIVAAALLGAGCEAKDGAVFGNFLADGTVSAMNLTSLGVPVSGGLANPSTTYELKPGDYTLIWTAGAVHTAPISIEANPPEKSGSFPFEGKTDGKDKHLFFFFSGNILSISEEVRTFTGTVL